MPTGIALIAAAAAWGAVFVNWRNTRAMIAAQEKLSADSIEAQKNLAVEAIEAQTLLSARASRASVVSTNRQRWIDALRDDVAEFIAGKLHAVTLSKATGRNEAEEVSNLKQRREVLTRQRMLLQRIELRCNPGEDNHKALLAALHELDFPAQTGDLGKLIYGVRQAAQIILKEEWERVKREASGLDDPLPVVVPDPTTADG